MERTMASSLKLPCSLLQFLADADRIAATLDREGDGLAALTGGRVHRGMAEEIRQLVAEVRGIKAKREKPRVGSAEPLKREARALVARVAAAARWGAEGDPVDEDIERLDRRVAKERLNAWISSQSRLRDREIRRPIAATCDLDVLARRCPSFRALLHALTPRP